MLANVLVLARSECFMGLSGCLIAPARCCFVLWMHAGLGIFLGIGAICFMGLRRGLREVGAVLEKDDAGRLILAGSRRSRRATRLRFFNKEGLSGMAAWGRSRDCVRWFWGRMCFVWHAYGAVAGLAGCLDREAWVGLVLCVVGRLRGFWVG